MKLEEIKMQLSICEINLVAAQKRFILSNWTTT